jgi:hypothetical protein
MGLRPIFSMRGLSSRNIAQTTKNPIAGLRSYQNSVAGADPAKNRPNSPPRRRASIRHFRGVLQCSNHWAFGIRSTCGGTELRLTEFAANSARHQGRQSDSRHPKGHKIRSFHWPYDERLQRHSDAADLVEKDGLRMSDSAWLPQ